MTEAGRTGVLGASVPKLAGTGFEPATAAATTRAQRLMERLAQAIGRSLNTASRSFAPLMVRLCLGESKLPRGEESSLKLPFFMSTSALVITSGLDRRGIPGVWLLRKGRDRLRYCVLVGGQNSGECGKISFLGKFHYLMKKQKDKKHKKNLKSRHKK